MEKNCATRIMIVVVCFFMINLYCFSYGITGAMAIYINIAFLLLSMLLFSLSKMKKRRVETDFLCLYLCIGSLYFILLPYQYIPDEAPHFYRIMDISWERNIISRFDENLQSLLPSGCWMAENVIETGYKSFF